MSVQWGVNISLGFVSVVYSLFPFYARPVAQKENS